MANKKYLVVVESPAKAKTIEKYLGKNFKVLASYGHVRDLVPKEGAVEPEHNFKMHYQAIDRNARHVEAIARALKSADELLLATDPDREGEAIAWHVKMLMDVHKDLKDKPSHRVVFHQITKNAVNEAILHPREISMDMVNAQQARRALDYLVGFQLSPLLWKKIRPGLSAGRVQSPALRMIVEREIEIENFKSEEYWTVHALCEKGQEFSARLTHYNGEKLEQFTLNNEKLSGSAVEEIKKQAKGKLTVKSVSKKQRKRHPAPPFITSTLQQEAARKLGFSASKTMQIAQQLYEGIDVGEGATGLITYMRTDSVNLAQEAIAEIRDFIKEKYGKKNLPDEPRVYKTKSKNAQEAHEAIRPTTASHTPDSIKQYLDKDQLRLYDLIWKRAVASQVIDATINTVAIELAVKETIFRANGSTIVDPGFIAIYQEGIDDKKKHAEEEDDEARILPEMNEGESVDLKDITGEQHFTEPPPRFTEASLVKALEEHDIGRPSTYASIIATLKNRKYVDMDSKRFKATDVGRIVNKFLTVYFTQYVDYDYTAHLEEKLDAVASGDQEWVPLLEEFWGPFKKLVDVTQTNVKRSDVTQEKIDEKCPTCGADLSIRLGKRGRFIGCTAYPGCDYTRNLDDSADVKPEIVEGRKCPTCDHDLVIKSGRYGKFIGCSHYPDCNYMEPLEKPKDTGVECPQCHQGKILERKSRRGKIFYSCEKYPDCKYALWDLPLNEPCPKCAWPILTLKVTKKRGTEKKCPQQGCTYCVVVEEPSD